MTSKSPTELFANVLLAQDEHLSGDVAKGFYQQLRSHPKIRPVCLNSTTCSGPQSCVPTPLKPDLGSRIHSPDPLIAWADLLVVVLGADPLAKMLHGITNDSFLLGMLRSWDVSKKIILVPCMSKNTWENPMTRKQLSKIRRKWNWIRVLEPIFSFGAANTETDLHTWAGMDEMLKTVQTHAEILTMGHDVHVTDHGGTKESILCKQSNKVILPSEIWSMILEQMRDWELAQALGIFTNLATPPEWQPFIPLQSDASPNSHSLEWVILTHRYSDIVSIIQASPPKWLSSMSVKLIFKFARTDLLSYLEANYKDLFWSTFGQRLLPTKASAVFGKSEILEWWKTSPSFLKKEYTAEAMDLASKAGFVHVLEWWRTSGLQLRYTEAALEQAGSLEVLEWVGLWRSFYPFQNVPRTTSPETCRVRQCLTERRNADSEFHHSGVLRQSQRLVATMPFNSKSADPCSSRRKMAKLIS